MRGRYARNAGGVALFARFICAVAEPTVNLFVTIAPDLFSLAAYRVSSSFAGTTLRGGHEVPTRTVRISRANHDSLAVSCFAAARIGCRASSSGSMRDITLVIEDSVCVCVSLSECVFILNATLRLPGGKCRDGKQMRRGQREESASACSRRRAQFK